jgi:oligopeptide transport system substrate-binding protein
MRRFLAIILCFMLPLCVLGGCASGGEGGKVLRVDIDAPVTNLDPQFTTDATARMILSNIGEGLLVRNPDGTLSAGAASQYTMSPDGKTYTFHLRSKAKWAGEDAAPVTAGDFVFAFRRIFTSGSASPYAGDYLLIENAEAVLAGELPASSLGIRAVDEYTLTITLNHPSELFPELLAATPAMPCSEAVFKEARGRYGLEKQFVGANGAFYVDSWTDTQINLRPNSGYVSDSPVIAGGVNLSIARENPADRFFAGNTDILQLGFDQLEQAEAGEYPLSSYEKTTWCIVFNQSDRVWGNALLRQSLAHALDSAYFADHLEANLTPTSVLIPPATRLLGTPYRDYADSVSPLSLDPDAARRLFALGLDALELDSLPTTVLYAPDRGGHPLNMNLIQQGWQKELSAYITVRQAPPEELERRFDEGDYDLLLLPFSPADYRIETLLSAFTTDSSQNRFGYHNPRYDQLLTEALDQSTAAAAGFRFSQAEKTLLSDAVIIPVYNETVSYAMGEGVEGIGIQPFGDQYFFRYGYRP